MEIKHLVQQFTYRIEPKPEGGFIARCSDPTVAPLEAPTREELQQKIQASLAAAIGEAFPRLKLPLQNHQTKFEIHIERKPGGGFHVHSEQQGAPTVDTAKQEKVEHFAEEILDAVDKRFPQLTQALAARVESKAGQDLLSASPATVSEAKVNDAGAQNSAINMTGDLAANQPITPESSVSWPILRFLVAVLIAAAMMYFFAHRH